MKIKACGGEPFNRAAHFTEILTSVLEIAITPLKLNNRKDLK